MDRFRKVLAWTLLVLSTGGLLTTMPMWLLGMIGNRVMLGITLALSWLALMYEAINAVQIAHDGADSDG